MPSKAFALIICTALLAASSAWADQGDKHKHGADKDEDRIQLGAHEHGHGFLNIAIDSGKLIMELQIPGSEVKPAVNKQPGAEAIEKLEKAGSLFLLSPEAKCGLQSAKAHFTVIGGDKHGKDDHKNHSEPGTKKDDPHSHKKPEHKKEAHAGHRDYYGEYAFTCERPSKLTEVVLGYFKIFPFAERLTVAAVGPAKAVQVDADAKSPNVSLIGLQ